MARPEASPLGKNTDYIEHYAPELLFPIPRQDKRDELLIDSQALPFFGTDFWTGYEVSWLNLKGKPQIAIVRFAIPADSPYLIESKSFKLYLNSYNQTKLPDVATLQAQLALDLGNACGKPVQVEVFSPQQFSQLTLAELDGESLDEQDIEVTNYHPQPEQLRVAAESVVTETLSSQLLKSNCLVTGQPDWGSVQIHYHGRQIDRESLLRYLIGFRQHNEFHEQCVERIFIDIWRTCAPIRLTVYARYTRRGGLDINPLRSTDPTFIPSLARTARQ